MTEPIATRRCGKPGCTGHANGVPLTSLAPGSLARVCETCLDPLDASMLRAMGLRPAATLRLCRSGEPCVVEVYPGSAGQGTQCERPDCRCRIGLARLLAERVMVTPIDEAAIAGAGGSEATK